MIGTITMTIKTGIGLAGPNPIPTATDTGVTVRVTHEEVTLDPITNPYTTVIMPQKLNHICYRPDTPHSRSSLCRSFSRDLDHLHHTNTTTKHQQDHLPAPNEQPGKPKTQNISRSPLMIHHLSTIAPMNKPVTQKMI